MMMNMDVKRKQLLLAVCVGVGAVMMAFGLFYVLGVDEIKPTMRQMETKVPIETATAKIDPHDIWRFKLETALTENKQKIDLLTKMMGDVTGRAGQPESGDSVTGMATRGIQELRDEIAVLKEQLEIQGNQLQGSQLQTNSLQENQTPTHLRRTSVPWEGDGAEEARQGMTGHPVASQPMRIQKVVLNLKERKKGWDLGKTTDNTIPAGAFARGTLLGGVDASTSIQSASDPRPVLLRLRSHGTLPRKLQSDLKNCHVLASGYGDLSSERVYMRLEKLTCTHPLTQEVAEMVVSGYVAGEDGKAGLRGVVVDKTGPLLRNSFIGGFFGGMGKFMTQAQQPTNYAGPLAASLGMGALSPLSHEQILKAGAGQCVSNALDKYADFYIKRAEQLQPVLQVAAGREVDVVFTASVDLSETLLGGTLAKHNDQRRRQKVSRIRVSKVHQQGDPSHARLSQESLSMKDVVFQHDVASHEVASDKPNNIWTSDPSQAGLSQSDLSQRNSHESK